MNRTNHAGLLALTLVVAACGSDGPEPQADAYGNPEEQIHTMERLKEKFEVTYQPGTVIVDNEAMRFMARPVIESNELVFDKDAGPYLDLQQGAVTIFPMAALVRVKSWAERGDSIVIQTEPALLTDAIKDADIESIVEIGWTQMVSQSDSPDAGIRIELIPTAYAEEEVGEVYGSISQTIKAGGMAITYKLKPQSLDRLDFEVSISANKEMYKKSVKQEEFKRDHPTRYVNAGDFHPVPANESYGDNLRDTGSDTDYTQPYPDADNRNYEGDTNRRLSGNVKGSIGFAKATGHISGFQQWFDLEISDGVPQDVYIDFKQLSGQMKLEAASLEGLLSTMKLSVPVEYVITVPIGGVLPLTFTLGADLSFRPIIEQGTSGSSKLCMIFEYEGSTGLRFSDGSFKNESTFRKRSAELCKRDETVSAGRLTVGMGTTFNIPKFKVSLFRLPIATSIHLMMDGVTTYEPGIASALQACQHGKQHLAVIAQATMKLFGILNTEVHAKLWDYKKEWTCEGTVVTSTFDKAGGEKKKESKR
ncbi:MAG: hypothetical protein QNJ14_04750 [Woeseiaceae bacterium]|nr:hypothetical protein [Woeseiaceae bacterium]